MKKILVASDSFKGSFSSFEVGKIFQEQLLNHQVDIISISDGGEGFSESILLNSKTAKSIEIKTVDDLNKEITINVVIDNKIAYFDVALIIALNNYQNISAIKKTTRGIALVLKKLFKDPQVNKIKIGIGGSSTSLIGFDMLRELGVKFLDHNNKLVNSWLNYKNIVKIIGINSPKKITIFSDVETPLIGKTNFTLYSKQKFMSDSEIDQVYDLGLHLSKLDNDLIFEKKGSGAAGGLGYAFLKYCNAKYESGIDFIIKISNLENISNKYDLLITGEGKFDKQSAQGKAVLKIKKASKAKQTILVAGVIENLKLANQMFDKSYQLKSETESIHKAIENTKENFRKVVTKVEQDLLL